MEGRAARPVRSRVLLPNAARQAISNPASLAPLGYQQGSSDKVLYEAIKVTSHLLPSFLNLGESREVTQEPHTKGDASARGEKRLRRVLLFVLPSGLHRSHKRSHAARFARH